MLFLDKTLLGSVSELLIKKLFSGVFPNEEVYQSLFSNKERKLDDLNPTLSKLLSSKTFLTNIGIDLPIWFGDFSSNCRTILIALDPKRNGKKIDDRNISVGSVFSLHQEKNRNNNENDYWHFVSFLSNDCFVYLTDVFKIYYETKNHLGEKLLSNKDKSFAEGEIYEIHKSILEDEIKIVKPNRIITLGRSAEHAVKEIMGIKSNEININLNGIEYIFIPHISRMVTQSIKTIGNLFKGLGLITQKSNIENIGENILQNYRLKEILT